MAERERGGRKAGESGESRDGIKIVGPMRSDRQVMRKNELDAAVIGKPCFACPIDSVTFQSLQPAERWVKPL